MPRQPLEQMLRLHGKTVLVTGGAMGIGRGIAERFAEAGASVVIADIDAGAGQAAATDIGATFVQADMSDVPSLHSLVAALDARGGADILVNNAGIYPFRPALEMTVEDWDRVMAVNLRGLFVLTQAFANAAVQRGAPATVVNIGSIDSFHPSNPGLAAYDASKGGLLMLTRSLALELAPHGIRINLIAPGGITTEGVQAAQGSIPSDLLNQFLARVPLGRWGEPDDIALMTLVLATPLSAYVTGAAFVVDGGRLLT
ncbi:MAG: SDR family oxidoreductase [Dehalococcoidia bacterium]